MKRRLHETRRTRAVTPRACRGRGRELFLSLLSLSLSGCLRPQSSCLLLGPYRREGLCVFSVASDSRSFPLCLLYGFISLFLRPRGREKKENAREEEKDKGRARGSFGGGRNSQERESEGKGEDRQVQAAESPTLWLSLFLSSVAFSFILFVSSSVQSVGERAAVGPLAVCELSFCREAFPPSSTPSLPLLSLVRADLPKTKSGKIMRRLLRKIACLDCEDLGDVSTLLNPSVVEELIEAVKASTDLSPSSSSGGGGGGGNGSTCADPHAPKTLPAGSAPAKKTYEELVQEKKQKGEGLAGSHAAETASPAASGVIAAS